MRGWQTHPKTATLREKDAESYGVGGPRHSNLAIGYPV